uniref:Uncharacterized protein n=1 Tax=Photinus pyralis TaxID=7054 RepID=A0A1Y1N495_PHOPY
MPWTSMPSTGTTDFGVGATEWPTSNPDVVKRTAANYSVHLTENANVKAASSRFVVPQHFGNWFPMDHLPPQTITRLIRSSAGVKTWRPVQRIAHPIFAGRAARLRTASAGTSSFTEIATTPSTFLNLPEQ